MSTEKDILVRVVLDIMVPHDVYENVAAHNDNPAARVAEICIDAIDVNTELGASWIDATTYEDEMNDEMKESVK